MATRWTQRSTFTISRKTGDCERSSLYTSSYCGYLRFLASPFGQDLKFLSPFVIGQGYIIRKSKFLNCIVREWRWIEESPFSYPLVRGDRIKKEKKQKSKTRKKMLARCSSYFRVIKKAVMSNKILKNLSIHTLAAKHCGSKLCEGYERGTCWWSRCLI